jgi:hypothetical protein
VLVGVGDYFVLLDRARGRAGPAEYERKVAAPLRAVIERGQAAAELRDDVPAVWLAEALVGLVVSVLRAAPRLGVEDRVAAIGAVFLEGVRARESSGIVSAPVG